MIPTQTLLGWFWAALGIYWVLSALRTKRTEVNEARTSRLLRLALLCAMFTVLLTDRGRVGVLAQRFVPESAGLRVTGIAVTIAGLSLAAWARHHLGANWSDKVVLKVDHELIRTGPYSFLRHPIYSGVLL